MQINNHSLFAVTALTFALVAFTQAQSQAQQPEPLRLSSPAPHVQAAPPEQAEAQTQTAQGELLDVDAKTNIMSIKTATSEMSFHFNEQTKVTGAQKGVAGLATMTGSQVVVQYRKDGTSNLATSIEVRGDQSPKK